MPKRRPRILILALCLSLATALVGSTVADEAPTTTNRGEELRKAARQGDVDTVRQLLDAGVDVNSANDYSTTAVSFAADKGHMEVLKLLVEHGADLTVTDTFYGTGVASWAAYNGHADATAFLVEHGAVPDGAVQMAIFRGHPEVVQAVIDTGKVKQESLDSMLSMVTLAARDDSVPKVEEVEKILRTAGAKLPPPPEFKADPAVLARYPGRYLLPAQEGVEATISESEGTLHVLLPDSGGAIPLDPIDPTTFRQKGGTAFEVRFQMKDDAVTGFEFHQQGREEPFVFVLAPPAGDGEQVADAADTPVADAAVADAAEATADTDAQAAAKPMQAPKGAVASHWPAFRGPNAEGSAQGKPPVDFDATAGKNVLWKTEVPGRAHASPIIWGDRVFLATAVSSKPEEPFRNGLYGDVDAVPVTESYSWQLMALSKGDGKVLWTREVHQGVPRAAHHIKATQANSTPVTDGKHVVAVMGSEGLFCYDFDGKLLWKNDLGKLAVGWFYDPSYEWGHSSSPILHDGKVILQVDRAEDPFIAAFSLEDGRELWRTPRENLPSWGTPTLIEGPKGMEVVTNGSKLIRAYDPSNGEELWSLGPHSEVTVGTPVVGHGLVYVTGGYRPVQPIYAIRPGGRGDISLPEGEESSEHIAWKTDRGGTYMPSPLIYGDHLYTLANNGVLGAYDAKTGERLWRERVAGRGGTAFTASPVAAAGRLYIASEDGDVYVVRHGREFELLATNPVGEIIMASPAISDDVLFVRSLDHLYAIGEVSAEAAAAAGAAAD